MHTERVRKARRGDLPEVASIYDRIHDAEESGKSVIGWIRGIYPVEQTAADALERDDLFVMEDEGRIVGTAILNQVQVESYEGAAWEYDLPDEKIMVMHTLIIDPLAAGRGYGKAFVAYYESYARECGCLALRMDTNERNRAARRLYAGLGYKEVDCVPCDFNGIPGIRLVLLEKAL